MDTTSEPTKLKKFHVEIGYFDGSCYSAVEESTDEGALLYSIATDNKHDATAIDTVKVTELIELDDTFL